MGVETSSQQVKLPDIFQGCCPNCGEKGNIKSMHELFMLSSGQAGGTKIALELLGFKFEINVSKTNPYARFLSKKQSPLQNIIFIAGGIIFFMGGLVSLVYGAMYFMIAGIVHLVAANPRAIDWWFLTLLPFGGFFLPLGFRILRQSQKAGEDYWVAYDAMSTVPVCRCGKILVDLPDVIR